MASKRKADETDLFSELVATMDCYPSHERMNWFRLPLVYALRSGKEQLVERLIDAAPDAVPGLTTPRGHSALSEAVYSGNLAVISMVLKAGVDIDETSGAKLETALMRAIWSRHEEAARFLLDKGAGVHVLDRRQNSALHHAGCHGSPRLVRDLLRAGAKRGTKNIAGETPLHSAVLGKRADIVSVLVSGADADELKTIVNAANVAGNSPLVSAALRGDEETALLLLNAGASCKAFFVYEGVRYPLLHVARKNLPVTQLLARHGASVHVETGETDGFSAFHWAVTGGSRDVVEYLAGNGSRLERHFYCLERGGSKFYRGTALHLAVLHGQDQRECIDVLIEKGANVNARDWNGFTPLGALCEAFSDGGVGWRVEVATVLLRAGADETIRNKRKKSPLDLITEGDDPAGALSGLLERASVWRRRKLCILLRARGVNGVFFLRQSKLSTAARWLIGVGEEGVFRRVISFM